GSWETRRRGGPTGGRPPRGRDRRSISEAPHPPRDAPPPGGRRRWHRAPGAPAAPWPSRTSAVRRFDAILVGDLGAAPERVRDEAVPLLGELHGPADRLLGDVRAPDRVDDVRVAEVARVLLRHRAPD